MDYDDERELTWYVWKHFNHLMTEFERRVFLAVIADGKLSVGAPDVKTFIERRYGLEGDAEVEAALADGSEAFRRKVAMRVLAEHLSEVFVNRCPACGRVVRTPKARQCRWCGHDWH